MEIILNWANASKQEKEVFFKPNRVLQQDFTGLPTLVEMATMRNAVVELGEDAKKINPACPVHMIIDHSIEVLKKYKSYSLLTAQYDFEFIFLKII